MEPVVITLAELEASPKACDVYLRSPEWDAERQALVYPDWSATVARLLSTRAGITWLDYLVKRGLVPMTRDEFNAARKA